MSGFAIKRNGRPMNASTIRLSRVSKRYGKRRVLHDVSFEVDQSELCALVGANGAGKSTLIKIVLGLCEPSSGSVELFGGKSKKELSLMRTRVGYVPDSCGAYQSLSAAENLRIRCAEWGLDEKRHDTERIDRSNVCNRIPDHVNNQRGKSDEHPCKNGCHAKTKLPDFFARLGHTLNAVGHTLTLIDSIVIRTVYRTTIWIACGKPRQCA